MRRIMVSVLTLAMLITLTACGGGSSTPAKTSGVEDGVLTVAMECNYAPYNWTQPDGSTVRSPSAMPPESTPTAMM